MAFFFLPTPPHVLTEPGFDSHLFCLGRHIIALLLKNAEGVRPTFFLCKIWGGISAELALPHRSNKRLGRDFGYSVPVLASGSRLC